MQEGRYDYVRGSTTDDEIRSAVEKRLDVVSAIRNAMETDDENDSMRLLSLYEEADETERAITDVLMINICGYTLSSIIREAEENGYLLDDED